MNPCELKGQVRMNHDSFIITSIEIDNTIIKINLHSLCMAVNHVRNVCFLVILGGYN